MTERRRRHIVGWMLPLAGIALAAFAALATKTPESLATNWGFDGSPNGSMSATAFTAMIFVLIVAMAGLAVVASRLPGDVKGDLSPPVAIATFLQWAFVGVAFTTYWANDGAPAWESASDLPVIPLATPVVAGAIAYGAGRLVRSIGALRTTDPADLATVGMGADETLLWIGHARATWPLMLAAPVAAMAVVLFSIAGPFTTFALLITAVALALFARITVTANRAGLTVAYGPFGWPQTTIGLERIEQARAIEVQPLRHGGWGYRGSLRLMGKAAVVIRSGDGLTLDLRDGKTFVVTVDDAQTGAGTINDLAGATVAS